MREDEAAWFLRMSAMSLQKAQERAITVQMATKTRKARVIWGPRDDVEVSWKNANGMGGGNEMRDERRARGCMDIIGRVCGV